MPKNKTDWLTRWAQKRVERKVPRDERYVTVREDFLDDLERVAQHGAVLLQTLEASPAGASWAMVDEENEVIGHYPIGEVYEARKVRP